MLKIAISIMFISFPFMQIQSEGTPKYYNNIPNDNINFISIDNNLEVDRNFNPMVFQFGIEYNTNISV